MSEEAIQGFHMLWQCIDEILNSVLYLLIGLLAVSLDTGVDAAADTPTASLAGYAYISVGILAISLVGRLISVSVGLGSVILLEWVLRRKLRHPSVKYRGGTVLVLTWAGMRGGLTVALALGILSFLPDDSHLANAIFIMTYSVVVWSIAIQGLFFEHAVTLIKSATRRYLRDGGITPFESHADLASILTPEGRRASPSPEPPFRGRPASAAAAAAGKSG
mmetsp:Transcript_21171/g.56545  ORF Transcript_21171/g.56545 Transcript_21171/m.56545 type:complete len:220 (-) Transcript_21171:360-1019(-)